MTLDEIKDLIIFCKTKALKKIEITIDNIELKVEFDTLVQPSAMTLDESLKDLQNVSKQEELEKTLFYSAE